MNQGSLESPSAFLITMLVVTTLISLIAILSNWCFRHNAAAKNGVLVTSTWCLIIAPILVCAMQNSSLAVPILDRFAPSPSLSFSASKFSGDLDNPVPENGDTLTTEESLQEDWQATEQRSHGVSMLPEMLKGSKPATQRHSGNTHSGAEQINRSQVASSESVDSRIPDAFLQPGRQVPDSHLSGELGSAKVIDRSPEAINRNVAETNFRQRALAEAPRLMMLIWIAGSALLGLRILFSIVRLTGIVRRANRLESGHSAIRLLSVVRKAADAVGLRRAPKLLSSRQVYVPAVFGIWNPVVLIPRAMQNDFTDRQLSQVFTHECVHILHRDTLLRLVRTLVSTLFWWHPLVHIVCRHLDQTREELCDNFVLREVANTEYGTTLLSVAKKVTRREPVPMTVNLVGSNWNLELRIRGLLNPRRKVVLSTTKRTWALCITGFACVVILASAIRVEAQGEGVNRETSQEATLNVETKEASAFVAEESVVESNAKETLGANNTQEQVNQDVGSENEDVSERSRNQEGYRLMRDGKIQAAIRVFELNVKSYPDSWNVYDSLAEAYALAGDYELAIAYYSKSLELNPDNHGAKSKLRVLYDKMQRDPSRYSRGLIGFEVPQPDDQNSNSTIEATTLNAEFVQSLGLRKRDEYYRLTTEIDELNSAYHILERRGSQDAAEAVKQELARLDAERRILYSQFLNRGQSDSRPINTPNQQESENRPTTLEPDDSLQMREVLEAIELLSKDLESLRREVGDLKRQNDR